MTSPSTPLLTHSRDYVNDCYEPFCVASSKCSADEWLCLGHRQLKDMDDRESACMNQTCRAWGYWICLVGNIALLAVSTHRLCDYKIPLIAGAIGTVFCAQYFFCFLCTNARIRCGNFEKHGRYHCISLPVSFVITSLFFANFVMGIKMS